MTPRQLKLPFAWTVAILACLYVAYRLFWLPTLVPHEGDGEFTDLSRRLGPFALPGYCIKLPAFDLGKPFEAEYRLTELSNIGRKCGVYLAIHDPQGRLGIGGWNHKVEGGAVRLQLLDSNGNARVQANGRPRDFIWYGFRDVHALYQMDHSFFHPRPSEEYTLRVSYAPDRRLEGLNGYAYLECGGHP